MWLVSYKNYDEIIGDYYECEFHSLAKTKEDAIEVEKCVAHNKAKNFKARKVAN